jgi:hypothetical protein
MIGRRKFRDKGFYPVKLTIGHMSCSVQNKHRGGFMLNHDSQFMPVEQRIRPGYGRPGFGFGRPGGFGVGFLGGLATGALLTPGIGFGYLPYPYYSYYGYPYYPYY